MKLLKIILIITLFAGFAGCSVKEKKVQKTAEKYFETFAERKDINKLLSFYSVNPKYLDAVTHGVVEGRENLKIQMNWNDKDYKSDPKNPKCLEVEEMLCNDSVVVANGHYNPYYYKNNYVERMNFSIWLYFDKDGKIYKQVDWNQYSNEMLEQILSIQKNMNIQ